MNNGTHWNETFLNEEGKWGNGSKEKEDIFFDKIAIQIREAVFQYNKPNHGAKRVNHAKIIAGFTKAIFEIDKDIPGDLAFAFLEPAAMYETVVRFSNASGKYFADDAVPDLRGIALRLKTMKGDYDLLMTNAEVHHALNAGEAMVAINSGVENEKYAGDINAPASGKGVIMGAHTLDYLVAHAGTASALRMADTLKMEMGQKVQSVASEQFFSRAPFAIGIDTTPENAVAVKFRLRPVKEKPAQEHIIASEDLETTLADELKENDVVFYFEVQRYSNADDTPIENSTKAWITHYEKVATLTIPKGSALENEAVDALTFSPWNVNTDNFRPLGNMNRARKKVYRASQDERSHEASQN